MAAATQGPIRTSMDVESSNVAHMLWRAAESRPDHPAIMERGDGCDYAALRARAAGYAEALADAGVGSGERVAIFLQRGAEAAAAFFGTAARGATAVILNENLRPRQLEHMLVQAGARVLVSSDEMMCRLPRPLVFSGLYLHGARVAAGTPGEPTRRGPEDLAQIIFTSGSTGLPKGVMVNHHSLWSAIRTVAAYLELRPDDRLASLLPFSSVYGLNQLLCAVLTGATLLVEHSPLASQVVASLRSDGATVLAAVPPLWLQLLGTPGFSEAPVESLRVLQNAGGHLPPDVVRRLRRAQPHARLFLQYGMTEVIRSTFLPPEQVDARPNSMGRPMPGAEVMVLREDLTPCSPGEVGELVHYGPTVGRGYWNDPEATARVFRAHPLRSATEAEQGRAVFSGDMVRMDEDGYLYFVGRRDRMIKSLGYRVGPDEVLDVLHASGQIREGLIDAEEDPQRGSRIVAYVVLADDGSLQRLEAFCRAEMPRYMQPGRFVVLTEIPRTPNGKHDLLALREQSGREQDAMVQG